MGLLISFLKYYRKNLYLLVIAFLNAFNMNVQAQDKLVFNGIQDTFLVKVYEITDSEITYKTWPPLDSNKYFTENKISIRFIILSNGSKLEFSKPKTIEQNVFTGLKPIAFKLDLFSIFKNINQISFEKVIKPGNSYEIGIGLIGMFSEKTIISFSENLIQNKGLLVNIGYKFNLIPNQKKTKKSNPNLLKGVYVKPELVLLTHSQENTEYDYYSKTLVNNKFRVNGMALVFNLGKQFVFYNKICLDINWGYGWGYENTELVSSTMVSNFSRNFNTSNFVLLEPDLNFNLWGTVGFKLGYLLNPKYLKTKSKSEKK